MGRGRRLGLRATVLVIVVIAATAVGILTPTLSNSVEKDVNIERQAIVLTVEGVPTTVAAGEFFRVVATMSNQANRPIPAVLRGPLHSATEADVNGPRTRTAWGARIVGVRQPSRNPCNERLVREALRDSPSSSIRKVRPATMPP